MTNKFLQLKALKRIIDDLQPFQVVLEHIERSKNLSSDDIMIFRSNVLGSLRHFSYLQFEAITAFPEFDRDDDEIYLMILALYEIRYHSKDVALYKVIDQVLETIDYMELRLDKEVVSEKLKYLAKNKTKIPNELKSDPCAYNSLFFNTPEWIIKMWINDFGDDQAMNILLANQRRANQYLCCNSLKCNKDDFQDDQRFIETENGEGALEYRGGSFSKLNEVKEGKLFAMDLSAQIMVDNLKYFEQQKILYIGEEFSSTVCGVGVSSKDYNVEIDALLLDEMIFARTKNLAKRLGIDNIKPFLGGVDLMLTYSEYANYDLVLLNPLSSCLGQVRRRPDVLVTLSEKEVNYYGRSDFKKLMESSKFVCPGGYLVYFVPTLTSIETSNVINKFLSSNSNFCMEYSRMIFPNEYSSDGFYFAILRRNS
ncbi:MAG TPA: hypothetical protein DCY93_02205 [Firmicutes bacterium]|nr:hypothetical protein [Bacillota bacterium]